MKEFTGLQYLQIDIANNFGMDHLTWDERILWTKDNENNLIDYIEEAKKQFLYYKGIMAYRDALAGKKISHIMYLDATSSGLQLMAAITGCRTSAIATNLISMDKPQSAYQLIADGIQKISKEETSKNTVKRPLMTFFYNKQSVEGLSPIQTAAFYQLVNEWFKGPITFMNLCNQAWRSDVDLNVFTLPDNHTAYIPVTEVIDTKIEVDELDHMTFNYRHEARKCSDWWGSLAPNITHAIEAYILRTVGYKCKLEGIPLAVVHDNFGTHPNFMNSIRRFYNEGLAEIGEGRIFQSILADLGFKTDIEFPSITSDILEADYTLN